MGSWYGTCGLSQFPIMYKEPVAIFMLVKNGYNEIKHNGLVNSDDMYMPKSPALLGKYYDSGKVKDVQADQRILRNMFTASEVYNEDEKKRSPDYIINNFSEKEGLYVMMIHEQIYKDVIEKVGGQSTFYSDNLTLKEFLIREGVEYLMTHRNSSEADLILNRKLDCNYFNRRGKSHLRYYWSSYLYGENIGEDKLFLDIIELLVFMEAMNSLRKPWMPQVGLGSQDIDYSMGDIINDFKREKSLDTM